MFPQDNHLRWKFGLRGDMPAVTVNTYDSDWPKDDQGDAVRTLRGPLGGGTIYVGTKGVMVTGTYGDNPRILPKDKHDEFPAAGEDLGARSRREGRPDRGMQGRRRSRVRASTTPGRSPSSC